MNKNNFNFIGENLYITNISEKENIETKYNTKIVSNETIGMEEISNEIDSIKELKENFSNENMILNNDEESGEKKELKVEEKIDYKTYKKSKIIEIFKKNEKFEKFIDILNNYEISDIYIKEMKNLKNNQKRKRRTKAQINLDKKKNINQNVKISIGRKKAKDSSKRKHNKNSIDNIIRKVKRKFFYYLIKCVNSILNKYEQYKKYKFKKLKPIISIRKDVNKNILEMKIEKLLSKDISSRYLPHKKNINQKNIEIIKQLEKSKSNNVIQYILNMKFREFIEYFTMKKFPRIEDINFEGLDLLLSDILKKDKDEQYFVDVVFCLYNYELWFSCNNPDKK